MHLAQDVGRRHTYSLEEHLVEVGVARHLAQRAHRDAGRVHVDDQHRDALALGARRVGPGEAGGEVAVLRTRGPHLLSVDDELAAIETGARLHAREVRAGSGLAEELAPDVLAAQQRWDQRFLLLLAGVHQEGGTAHPEPDLESAGWDLEGLGLAVEDALEPAGQPAPPNSVGQVMPARPASASARWKETARARPLAPPSASVVVPFGGSAARRKSSTSCRKASSPGTSVMRYRRRAARRRPCPSSPAPAAPDPRRRAR